MLVKLKFPANAMTLTQALIKIAQFDIIETGELLDSLIYILPEQIAFNIGF